MSLANQGGVALPYSPVVIAVGVNKRESPSCNWGQAPGLLRRRIRMRNRNSTQTGRKPPDEPEERPPAARFRLPGAELQLTWWALAEVLLTAVALVVALLFWMSPEQLFVLISLLRGS